MKTKKRIKSRINEHIKNKKIKRRRRREKKRMSRGKERISIKFFKNPPLS
jgi:hypothetical protein